MKRPLVAAVAAAAVLSIGGVALARVVQYRAEPVGAFEVPANDSTAEAKVRLRLDERRDRVHYDLTIKEPIENVTQAHLHMAAEGVNGPVVAWLYPEDVEAQVLIPGETDGRLARGIITPADLRGPLVGNWDGFVAALEDGLIYANVHTTAFPPGEIRDQVEAQGHHGN